MMDFVRIALIILVIASIIVCISSIYLVITSKRDTPLAKRSVILTILFGIIGLLGLIKVDTNVQQGTTDVTAGIKQMADDIGENQDVSSAIDKAEDAFASDGYQSAIDVLTEMQKKYPDNETLKNEIKRYKGYRPVLLSNYEQLKNTANDETNQFTSVNEYRDDKFGNTYSSSFSISGGTVSFVLNQKYSKFRGVVACPKEYEYNSNRDFAKVSVYDDETLLWSSDPVYIDTEPQPFDIDITGTDKLVLVWECEGWNVWQNWGAMATIFDGAFYPLPD